jgi:ABC-type multidrug transport system, ATPase component
MLEIKDLEFSYGRHNVFNNVNLKLEPGMIYGLLGQNGVGKTTLLKIIAGLLKVKHGSCSICCDDKNNLIPYDRKPSFLENIFYLPEDYAGPDVIIEDYAKSIGNFYPNFDIAKFYNIAKELDVNVKSKFTKLSFGQQKKGIISIALSMGTDILLLDEPSNGLDIPSKTILRQIIAHNATDNQMIIISTHQVKDLENLIDPIIILDKNGVVINETIDSISKKLLFEINPTIDKEALYTENVLNGYINVKENTTQIESNVNIEALFNCVITNKEKIKLIFKK